MGANTGLGALYYRLHWTDSGGHTEPEHLRPGSSIWVQRKSSLSWKARSGQVDEWVAQNARSQKTAPLNSRHDPQETFTLGFRKSCGQGHILARASLLSAVPWKVTSVTAFSSLPGLMRMSVGSALRQRQ